MEFVIARCRSEAVRTVEFDFVVHGRTLAMAGPPGQLLTNLMA
jgi:hypothetical protein